MSDEIISIVIDQRYEKEDIERQIEEIVKGIEHAGIKDSQKIGIGISNAIRIKSIYFTEKYIRSHATSKDIPRCFIFKKTIIEVYFSNV